MVNSDRDSLRAIKTFPSLVKYLRDELDWPIETTNFEDLTFDWQPEELGIDPKIAAKIQEIKQLRPITTNQPWGIFFIKFEPKRLPVVVLRRILSQLVIKKRAAARRSEQASWNLHDLLFISNYGEDSERQITFAHFSQDEQTGDLPTLKVLGWDDADTVLHIEHTHRELKQKLHWPDDETDLDTWRRTWSSAFTLRHREVITTSKDLAAHMADLAKHIRRRADTVLAIETERGPLRKLYKAFQKALIHDLSEDDFADMYAQTITYGLLAARVSRPMGIISENVADMVPGTNIFLKEMLSTFLTTGGRKGAMDFDELGIQEVVELLNSQETRMEAILREFGNRTRQEDPVMHFYESFLLEYDREKKVKRGVFYTPQPVVSYIVRSIHGVLQGEFGLKDGLADTTTWDEMSKRNPSIDIPEGTNPNEPFVQILDPALGTGTFLVEVIDVVYKTMTAKWEKDGHMPLEFNRLWNEYVPKYLLSRLYGYELMMAPYAIAHMKIGLKLYETGYRFGSEERVRVYLTNSLEEAPDASVQHAFEQWAPSLAHEALAVNAIKRGKRFTVIIGNPPYSGIPSNNGKWIQDLVRHYYFVDDKPLDERNPKWLLDDYVKFIRLSETMIDSTGLGVVGLITNHGFIANPTFRGLRWSLMCSFDRIYVLDLHGNQGRKEESPRGGPDGNVFDIKQGVAISMLLLHPSAIRKNAAAQRRVFHRDLWGTRAEKYEWLAQTSYQEAEYQKACPQPEFWLFRPQDEVTLSEYGLYPKLTDLFFNYGVGMTTARDGLVIDFERNPLVERATSFRDFKGTDSELCDTLEISEKKGWNIERSRRLLRSELDLGRFVTPVAYRPFDNRYIFYHDSLVWRTVKQVMRHMLAGENLALISARSNKSPAMDHFFCTRLIMETKCGEATTQSCLFPLYSFGMEGELGLQKGPQSNLNIPLINGYLGRLPAEVKTDLTPEDAFRYAYGVFHSPTYRQRYAEFLKIDFPRLPISRNLELFSALTQLGGELVDLHLMESPKLDNPISKWQGVMPSSEVEKVAYLDGTVWIDKARTEGFRGVPEDVWNFHIGGYQVCHKWLKDRKGHALSAEDIVHYQKIVVALNETIRLMKEIDEVIKEYGGWPGAFVTE